MYGVTVVSMLFITNTATQQQHTVQFQITSSGMEFGSTTDVDLIASRTNTSTISQCATACLIDLHCLKFDFDTASHVCRLFST